jgi:hypothetical protein
VLPFLHDRAHRLDLLLTSNSGLLLKYSHHDWDLNRALEAYLADAVEVCKGLSLASTENELAALTAQFESARRGLNPFTMEPVTTRRRSLERAVALHVLTTSGERVRADYGHTHRQLDEGRVQARALLLNALARGVLRSEELPLADVAAAEALWKRILADQELQLAARQLSMHLHTADITILIYDLAGPR